MESSRRSLAAVVVLVALVSAGAAEAVPSFARKYVLNCNACHTNEPRLNPFGQRFQENGYQLPGTEDGGTTGKRQLGNLALDSVTNLISARVRADVQKASFREETEATDSVDFVVPNIVNLFVAGTAHKNIGYFLEAEYAPGEGHAELIFERVFAIFSNLGSRHQALNVKLGEFDPSAYYAFPTHRQQMNPIFPDAHTEGFPPEINRIPVIPLAFSSKMFGLTTGPGRIGEDGFSILPFEPYLYNAPAQLGIALYGRPAGENLFYQIGVVQEETAEDEPDTRFDYHLTLRYDLPTGKNRAMQVSGFYYHAPDAARPTLAPMGNLFFAPPVDWDRYGFGARMQYKMFDIYGTVVWDTIDQPVFAAPPLFVQMGHERARRQRRGRLAAEREAASRSPLRLHGPGRPG